MSSVTQARQVQERLRSLVRHVPLRPDRLRLVGAADVTFLGAKEMVAAAIVVFDMASKAILEERAAVCRVRFPYVPGYLAFREGPAIAAAWETLSHRPDVMLFDGHGIAHPRRVGIASHMGVLLSVPSVGCAKKRLAGEHDSPGLGKGDTAPLSLSGETVGAAVRTRAGVKPVFVSPGHLADLPSSVALVLALCSRYRIPDPARRAHQLTQEIRKAR
ncbi:MAG: endonuclease V [Candidatus Deferrimicrobiaceae bacterium]